MNLKPKIDVFLNFAIDTIVLLRWGLLIIREVYLVQVGYQIVQDYNQSGQQSHLQLQVTMFFKFINPMKWYKKHKGQNNTT